MYNYGPGTTGPVNTGCGALPYMTVPIKAIAPILLEDTWKVAVGRKGVQNFF